MMKVTEYMQEEIRQLKANSNYRSLPLLKHEGKYIIVGENRMLNLSSNDYLGVANNVELRREFLETLTPQTFRPTASSSRLLTGNFDIYSQFEAQLATLFGTESALVFNSGYHANTGILPAVSNAQTLILADKLVHASLIDGIRLSTAKCIRYRHNDLQQLERLLNEHGAMYNRTIIVTESIFSMDGDVSDLRALVTLKHRYPNVLLYVDEAHAFGVRGVNGLGCAEEQNCISDIDFLVGTFGKAAAAAGAYLVCSKLIREYLINKMRTFIFTTALPPVTVQWTSFVVDHLAALAPRRQYLLSLSQRLKKAVEEQGGVCPSSSHIVPFGIGSSKAAVIKGEELQRKGFYALPVRPPTVPEGTSRIRFSLTADMNDSEIDQLIELL